MDGDEDEEGEGDIDEELAAELDMALGDEGGEDEEEDEEDDDSEEEDEDDEDDEDAQARKLLNEEIRDLEAAVAKKNHEIASSANPLIKVTSNIIVSPMFFLTSNITETVRGCPEETVRRSGNETRPARGDEREATATKRWRFDGRRTGSRGRWW